MDLDELQRRLGEFCRHHYADALARVFDVHAMPGHAGFAWGFGVESRGTIEHWFLRLPPPGVQWTGTADVLRQVEALNALEGSSVPHCSVRWSGADTRWFGSPYFIVPKLAGDVLRLEPGAWGTQLSATTQRALGRQAMAALAAIHRTDWQARAPRLGPPIPLADDVTRWDRIAERAAEPERLRLLPAVRARLLATLPADPHIGLFHGDFQCANLFCSPAGDLLAVIDWELTGIGATLNDLGWIATFSDPRAWPADIARTLFLDPETLIADYAEARGEPLADIDWFRALGAYKFAIIAGFNLSLHRRGKRHDPLWEDTRFAMDTLMARALELLDP